MRLVLVTHMPTHVGTVTDAAEIGTLVRPSGAIYALDVAQTVGQMPVDVEAIGCDVAFAPARKFLRAPRGTGLLYVRRALADQLVPLTPAFGTEIDERTGRFVLALGAASVRAVRERDRGASRARCRRSLRDPDRARRDRRTPSPSAASRSPTSSTGIDGVKLAASRDSRGIVSFVHDSLDPVDIRVASRLTA